MRRSNVIWIVALVLMTAAFGVAWTSTPDGETPAEETVCDVLQDPGVTPGLYGLCVAFCEAHDYCVPDQLGSTAHCKPASKKIYDKYEERRQVGDPAMPCLACFSADSFDLVSFPQNDGSSGFYETCVANPQSGVTLMRSFVGVDTYFAMVEVNGLSSSCLLITPDASSILVSISEAEALLYREILREAQCFGDVVCPDDPPVCE